MTRFEPNNSLYMIAGWFWNSPIDTTQGRYPFGGCFDLDEQHLEGRLSDDCGTSRITGTMTPKVLEFVKTYRKREDEKKGRVFHYKFEKKSGIWVGGWDSRKIETPYLDHNPSMQAHCLALPVWDAYRAMNERRLDGK
jgi:hypothetical protein